MPAWLLPLLLKYVLPVVLEWLQKSGHINAAEELAAKGAVAMVKEVKDMNTYPDYPSQNSKGQR